MYRHRKTIEAGGYTTSRPAIKSSYPHSPHSQVITAPEAGASEAGRSFTAYRSVMRYGTSRRYGGRSCSLRYAIDWEVVAAVSEKGARSEW